MLMNMAESLSEVVDLPFEATSMNVFIHEDNEGK